MQPLMNHTDLAGRKVVVTAGGTREPIDPVRVITNRSSGKMGFALTSAAKDRGARTHLITTVPPPDPEAFDAVERVETVAEIREAVLGACTDADLLLMAAAVSDYRAVSTESQKIKSKDHDTLTLELVKTDDFLLELPDDFVKVGFAAETENLVENARRKLEEKRLDLICANDVTARDSGFGTDTNRVTILDASGRQEELPLLSKVDLAHEILDRAVRLLGRTP